MALRQAWYSQDIIAIRIQPLSCSCWARPVGIEGQKRRIFEGLPEESVLFGKSDQVGTRPPSQ